MELWLTEDENKDTHLFRHFAFHMIVEYRILVLLSTQNIFASL